MRYPPKLARLKMRKQGDRKKHNHTRLRADNPAHETRQRGREEEHDNSKEMRAGAGGDWELEVFFCFLLLRWRVCGKVTEDVVIFQQLEP